MKPFTLFDPSGDWDFVGKIPTALIIAGAVPIICILAIVIRGFPFGLDFSGGTEMQVKFEQAVTDADVRDALKAAGFDKMQVQQIGSPEDHEMLIRIERVTSLDDTNIEKMKASITANWSTLQEGNTAAGPDTLQLQFRAEEGDRVSVWLPQPNVQPKPKNTNVDQIKAELTQIRESINLADEEAAKAFEKLNDGVLAQLAARGFDRAAVTAQAKALGWTVTATPGAQVEKPFEAATAQVRALDRQEQLLTKLLDEESGAKIRRSKRTGDEERTTEGSVVREEPYQGKVKYLVLFRGVSNDIEKALGDKLGKAEVLGVSFVDAQVAKDLQTDGALAVIYALFFILVYVAIRFDIFFSPGAIVALIHDAFGAVALFAIAQIEFEVASIAALLTVVGYSINNTIVVYDRIRETMPEEEGKQLSEDQVKKFVNKAINDTFSRTVNTTITTLAASVSLFVFAGGTVKNFAAVLSAGILLGAFSSTFLAPAAYLFFRKQFHNPTQEKKTTGLSRDDKARGVV